MTRPHVLVVGKFLPLHVGHVALIEHARTVAGDDGVVTVVLGPRWDDPISPELRVDWLVRCAPFARVVVASEQLPTSPAHAADFWPQWTAALARLAPHVTHVASSEAYGDELAAHVGATHVPFDPSRTKHPVSATRIRRDPWAAWELLPAPVRGHFTRTVALVGGESVGKTTLAARLAAHYRTGWVPEWGRNYTTVGAWQEAPWEDDRAPEATAWTAEDAVRVARAQSLLVADAQASARGLVIADTEQVTTAVWTEVARVVVPEALWRIQRHSRADLYLLLEPDVAWHDDGTRRFGAYEFRRWFSERLRTHLERLGLPWVAIGGDGDARLGAAVTAIEQAKMRWFGALAAWDESYGVVPTLGG
ncbi:MAG: AAA family ATPase [Gemmatimonadaceae bacterium]|jgi:NadR type nicotinamide-nucleotide adenylyltransferase|nr:AAA family ATPase [Gemmatimonadaceae bacterium]